MDYITVFNLKTGQTGTIRRDWFEHPVINPGILVEATPGQKPYVEGMYKEKTEEPEVALEEIQTLDVFLVNDVKEED